MTIADTIEAHQARCQPHLLTLRMIAHEEAAPVLTRRAVMAIAQATRAVLAEAETAARAACISADGPGAEVLVRVRLKRLAASAEDVISAAGSGDCAQMRCHMYRFDTLTAAIWTVQRAICGGGGQGHSAG